MSKGLALGTFRAKDEMLAAISRRPSRDSPGSSAWSAPSPVPGGQAPPRRPAARALRHRQPLLLTVFFSEEASLPARIRRQLAAQKDRYDKGGSSIRGRGASGAASSRDVRPPRGLRPLGMLNWLYKWYTPRAAGRQEVSGAFSGPVEDGLSVGRRGQR